MHILLKNGQNLVQTIKTQRDKPQKRKASLNKNMAKDEHGPEFDDRLIVLVRENPAIYDMGHPHYRRTPVRMSIWDNIARELGAPSRYLQTKWKNIRYNYLQEQKCLETGIFNANIRKRRFTADLSFLKNTAFRRENVPVGTSLPKTSYSENESDSSSFMYPDNLSSAVNSTSFEVIELDHSDDEGQVYLPDVSAFLAPMNNMNDDDSPQDPYAEPDISDEAMPEKTSRNIGSYKKETKQTKANAQTNRNEDDKMPDSPCSDRSSPLLTPMKPDSSNGNNNTSTSNYKANANLTNGNKPTTTLSEVTIRPVEMGKIKRRPSSTTSNENFFSKSSTCHDSQRDPIELYCLSLVDCLRAMPRSERERVKFEFSKILKDAQYTSQS